MKQISSAVTRIALIVGLMIGGFAISVIAEEYSPWVGPNANPPSNNKAAPINISSTAQSKLGKFGIKWSSPSQIPSGSDFDVNGVSSATKLIAQQLQILGGCSGGTCADKVLTSDANGNATWQDAAGGATTNNPQILSAAFTLNPPVDRTNNTIVSQPPTYAKVLVSPKLGVTVNGAAVGDTVLVSQPSSGTPSLCAKASGYVDAPNHVYVLFWAESDYSPGCSWPTGPYNVRVIK